VRHVILDTNCIGLDAPLGGNAQRLLVDAAERGQLVLVIPELVVSELMNVWGERADERLNELRASAKGLASQGIEVDPLDPKAIETRREEVEQELRLVLSRENFLCPAFPEASHEQVVQRALDRRQPFDAGGKDGYRDALLWETVLELAAAHDVILVSNDRRAYAGKDKDALSSALVDEARERCGRNGAVTLYTSPSSAVEHFASEDEGVLNRVERLLEIASFRTVFREQLEPTVEFQELNPDETAALIDGTTIGLASISELIDLGRTEVDSAYAVGDDLGLVELTILASAGISFFTSIEQARELSRRSDVVPVQGEWDELRPLLGGQAHLSTYRYVELAVSAAIRLNAGAVDRMELTDAHIIDETQYAPAPPALDLEVEDEEESEATTEVGN